MNEELPSRFAELAAVLNQELVERPEEIRAAFLALISGTSLFMLGEPGIAKSLLARRLHAYISGGQFFDLDLDKFTVADDVFGPRSLSAMKEDRWERATEGTIVDCDWAMLDEFFEASSALLKTLLRALNERTFRQGKEIIPMRMTALLAASNEVPVEPRLVPLYDRLLIRRQLHRITDRGAFLRMLETRRPEHPEPILAWSEVLAAQAEAASLEVTDRVLTAVYEIREELAAQDIHPSDRRMWEAMKVIRAAAWYDGSDVVEPEHVRVLSDICWAVPEQIPVVTEVVDRVLEPLVSEADNLLRAVHQLGRAIRTDLDDSDRKALAAELHRKLRQATKDLAALKANRKKMSRRETRKVELVDVTIAEVSYRVATELFLVPAEEMRAS